MDNIQRLKKKVVSNDISIFLRNCLSYRPSIYNSTKNDKESVSDFFYWDQTKNNETKFIVTNICSHVLPDYPQDDNIQIIIFDSNGKKIKEKKLFLSPFETKEFFFDDNELNGKFGSFFVFHKFKEFGKLIENGCHIAERGYTAFRSKKGLWNFVHGNHYAAALTKDNKIYSLISKSFFKTIYKMQLSIEDTNYCSLIFNNPSNINLKIHLHLFDKNKIIKIKRLFNIKPFCTEVIDINEKKISSINIISNVMMCRPLIKKYYKTYFDILHT